MKFGSSLLILAISFIVVLAQKTTTPKQVLHDFRIFKSAAAAKIPVSTQKNVLSKVFRKYLRDERQCNPNFSGDLEAARAAGQIAPMIIDSTTGSFTAPGQTQTAYVISVSECGASHADNFGSDRVAIFSGNQLVVDLDVEFRSSIIRKTDLNGDGVDELLMTSGYMGQGVVTEGAALLSFQDGKLKVIEDFGTVREDSCASGFPGSNNKASVLSYRTEASGSWPKLQQENYEASCKNPKRWRFLSTGKIEGQ